MRYEIISQRCILHTRHANDETLATLGLTFEVNRLFNNLGLHYLVHGDFLVYACMNLEFLCILYINMYKTAIELCEFNHNRDTDFLNA